MPKPKASLLLQDPPARMFVFVAETFLFAGSCYLSCCASARRNNPTMSIRLQKTVVILCTRFASTRPRFACQAVAWEVPRLGGVFGVPGPLSAVEAAFGGFARDTGKGFD